MTTLDARVQGLAALAGFKPEQVVSHWPLDYNVNEEWLIANTPTGNDGAYIARQVVDDTPYVSFESLKQILSNAFDNVFYGEKDGRAKADVLFSKSSDSLEIAVINPTNMDLPKKIRNKTYTVKDGKFDVPDKERHPETGGGFGILSISNHLPHLYDGQFVSTTQTARISWTQKNMDVIFKVTIPRPSEAELLVYTDFIARRDLEAVNFAKAKPYFVEDGVAIKHPEAVPLLIAALNSTIAFPEKRGGIAVDTIDITKTIAYYGKEAKSAADPVIDAIMKGKISVFGGEALLAIEEKGYFSQRLALELSNYKSDYYMVVNGILSYFFESQKAAPEKTLVLKNAVEDYFVSAPGKMVRTVSEYYISKDASLMPQSNMEKVLDRILKEKKISQDGLQAGWAVYELAKAQKTLTEGLTAKLKGVAALGKDGASSYLVSSIERLINPQY